MKNSQDNSQKGEYMQGNLVPTVIEKTGRGERSYDIYSRLLKDRIIFIGPVIDDYSSSLVIAQNLLSAITESCFGHALQSF